MILRSDYMIDQPTNSLRLVEYNTIASSFGCLSNMVRDMHRYVIGKYGDRLPLNYGIRADSNEIHTKYLREDPEMAQMAIHDPNYSYADNLVDEFKRAIVLYKESTGLSEDVKPWVLFVCEDDERNLCDQKIIEVQL